jgi:hypothetical protein
MYTSTFFLEIVLVNLTATSCIKERYCLGQRAKIFDLIQDLVVENDHAICSSFFKLSVACDLLSCSTSFL